MPRRLFVDRVMSEDIEWVRANIVSLITITMFTCMCMSKLPITACNLMIIFRVI